MANGKLSVHVKVIAAPARSDAPTVMVSVSKVVPADAVAAALATTSVPVAVCVAAKLLVQVNVMDVSFATVAPIAIATVSIMKPVEAVTEIVPTETDDPPCCALHDVDANALAKMDFVALIVTISPETKPTLGIITNATLPALEVPV